MQSVPSGVQPTGRGRAALNLHQEHGMPELSSPPTQTVQFTFQNPGTISDVVFLTIQTRLLNSADSNAGG